ncbi:M23 family metallopeptidase [Candidatus Gottesmanbacteria bacterium]|nr:M23 family metallopeptidase [Candidatus Gottesmanbacteria bacterium]
MDNNSQGLITSLIAGVGEIKKDPNFQVPAGIDRGSFELLISRLTGTNDITHEQGLLFIEERLNQVAQSTVQLKTLSDAYVELKKHYIYTQETLLTLKRNNTPLEEINRVKQEMLFKSKAYTATIINLPEEINKNPSIASALARDYFGASPITNGNIGQTVTSVLTPMIAASDQSKAAISQTALNTTMLTENKNVQLKRIVVANLKRLQKYPMASNLGGIPYESFSILVKKLTGKPDLKLGNPGGLKDAIAIISGLDTNSQALNTTVPIFEMLRRHSLVTRLKLLTPEGEEMTPYQKEIALKYMPEQMFLATVLTQLPDEVAHDPVFQNHLEAELKDYDIHADRQREASIFQKVNNAVSKSGKTISPEQLKIIAKNTANNVSKTMPKGITLGQTALAVALTLANQLPKDQQPFAGEQVENLTTSGDQMEDEFGFGGGGMAIGGVLGLSKYGKEKPVPQGDEEAFIKAEYEEARDQESKRSREQEIKEEQPAVVSSATSAPTIPSGLFINAATRIKGGLSTIGRGLATVLTPGGWLKGIGGIGRLLLGGLLGRGGQNQSPALAVPSELRNISVGVAILIGVLIVSFSIGDNKKAAAFVTGVTGCVGELCPVVNPIIAQNPTTTPSQQQPNPPNIPIDYQPGQSNTVPSGFPINSSCVTQKPFGTVSHQNSNAVDVVVLGNSPDNWIIRATHDGTVAFAGCGSKCTRGYGYYAIIRSLNNQYLTIYGHMQLGSLRVKAGDNINKGQPLGIVNTTGFSTGNHLHYELRSVFGQYYNQYGAVGSILNFLPAQSTWQCNL